ncbi:MAG TPA: ATP-binding protein [Allosphingosinicella sp.]
MAEADGPRPATNGAAIEAEIAWFTEVLDRRFRIHGGELGDDDILAALPPPSVAAATPYGEAAQALSAGERLVLILAVLPLLRPQALDSLLIPNSQSGRPFTEFGGAPAGSRSGFQPTRETALFLIAGENMDRRLAAMALFDPDSPLHARRILDLPSEPGEPGPWTALHVNPAWLGRLTTGRKTMPRFGPDFPAQEIATAYEWDDLVLPEEVKEEIEDLVAWVENEAKLMDEWGLGKHLKPGYRALFHGPPGTGKTVTAAVLGKRLGRPVYRVDLSRVTSKWIGETEKNLAALFDHAAEGDMILFFDEADALFGKRGDTKSANDRHSNQQIAYLLQRIEDCPGVVILASNLKANIDPAFARRFQAMVSFTVPDAGARRTLWANAFGAAGASLDAAYLDETARRHELAGGAIVNVLRGASVQAVRRGARISPDDVDAAIRRERLKEGKVGT